MNEDHRPGESALLARVTTNPEIFGGKPIIRGHRLAVEHVLGMLVDGFDLNKDGQTLNPLS